MSRIGTMAMKLNKRIILICITTIIIIGLLYFTVTIFLVGQHQKSVTIELKQWQEQYSSISSKEQALKAVEMLEYISRYYLPGKGYRSTSKIEQELESQRIETLTAIIKSLETFTGQKHGNDIEKWKQWQKTQ